MPPYPYGCLTKNMPAPPPRLIEQSGQRNNIRALAKVVDDCETFLDPLRRQRWTRQTAVFGVNVSPIDAPAPGTFWHQDGVLESSPVSGIDGHCGALAVGGNVFCRRRADLSFIYQFMNDRVVNLRLSRMHPGELAIENTCGQKVGCAVCHIDEVLWMTRP